MREPSPSLFGAFYRARGEDRLTEVLATVLERSPALANAVVAKAELGLPPAHSVRTGTQVIANPQDRVDLEVRGYDEAGNPLWLVWSEQKTYTSFHGEQLRRYRDALPAYPFDGAERRLMAILLRPPTAEERAEGVAAKAPILRWDDIARLAQRIGDSDCREWIDFYNNEIGEPVPEPLTAAGVGIAVQAQELWSSVEYLAEQGLQAACERLQMPAPKWFDPYWQSAPSSGWAGEHGARLYIEHDMHGEIGGRPAFKIGVFFQGEDATAQGADADRSDRMRDAGLGVYVDDQRRPKDLDIWGEVAMDDLAALATLEEQQDVLAQRCADFFRLVLEGDLEALTAWPTRQ